MKPPALAILGVFAVLAGCASNGSLSTPADQNQTIIPISFFQPVFAPIPIMRGAGE